MSSRLPDIVDPVRLTDIGQSFSGELPVSRMDRLASQLVSSGGAVDVQLEFGVDENKVRYIRGQARAELSAICQRCLEVMALPINVTIALGLVHSIEEGERLPAGYEPLVLDDKTIALSTIVEDELILALPVVVIHPEGACSVSYEINSDEDAEAGDKPNPFAVLANIKTRQQKK